MSNRVKKSFTRILLHILNHIDKGDSLTIMSKNIGISKQLLSYYMRKLREAYIIERIESHPFAIYKLTPLGCRVKDSLVHSDTSKTYEKTHTKPLWKCHNLIVGFDIKTWGNWHFNQKLMKEMKNWKFQKLHIKGHNINIHDTGLIKIYCPSEYADDTATAWANMYSNAQKIANFIASKYHMEIGNLRVIREGQHSICGSEKIGELLGHIKLGKVWIDASEGSRELEESQSGNKLIKLLALPDAIDDKLVPVVKQLTEQITLHLEVMQEMKETLKEIRWSLNHKK